MRCEFLNLSFPFLYHYRRRAHEDTCSDNEDESGDGALWVSRSGLTTCGGEMCSGKDRLELTDAVAAVRRWPSQPSDRTMHTGQQSLSLNTCWLSWGGRAWRVVLAVIRDGWGRLESNEIDIISSFSSRRRSSSSGGYRRLGRLVTRSAVCYEANKL